MTSQTRTFPRLLKKLALAATVFVIGLGLSELGFRMWLRMSGRSPFDSALAEQRFVRAVTPLQPFVANIGGHIPTNPDGSPISVLHPYTGAEYSHDTGGVLAHFRQGIPKNDYTVVVVGGSVASLFANGGGPELENLLSRDPRLAGRHVRVLDYAHPAYKQPQQVMRLAYLFSLGYRPDAVINIDGFNEVALGSENATSNANPVYPTFPIWGFLVQDFGALEPAVLDQTLEMWQLRGEGRALAEKAVHWRLYKSSIASYIVLHRLARIMNRRNELQAAINSRAGKPAASPALYRQMNGPDFDKEPSKIFELCLRNWVESSRSILALCQCRGIPYLHVIQPTLHDPGAKPLTAEEKALSPGPDTWKPGVLTGYPLLREHVKDLRSSGVTVLDATHVFANTNETLYFDACHFNAVGDRILAQFIAPYFLEHVLAQYGAGGAAQVSTTDPLDNHLGEKH